MTPEHKFTIFIAALTGLPTIFFTGVVAFWTWRRDQERIIVQKSPTYWKTLDGTDGDLEGVGIIVTNLSLFPVRIAGLGFRMDGKHALAFDPDDHHTDEWPVEVPSHSRMVVRANPKDWKKLEALGVRNKIMDWGFVAVALTETGNRFSSNRMSVGIRRPLRYIRQQFSKSKVSAT
jgi:hypothetical protein